VLSAIRQPPGCSERVPSASPPCLPLKRTPGPLASERHSESHRPCSPLPLRYRNCSGARLLRLAAPPGLPPAPGRASASLSLALPGPRRVRHSLPPHNASARAPRERPTLPAFVCRLDRSGASAPLDMLKPARLSCVYALSRPKQVRDPSPWSSRSLPILFPLNFPYTQVGYIRLSEFNSECKAKVADALRDRRSFRPRPSPALPGTSGSPPSSSSAQVRYIRLSEFNSECKAKVADALREMNAPSAHFSSSSP
jgi:hypothetical protein